MRVLVAVLVTLAAATAHVVNDRVVTEVVTIGKDSTVTWDIKKKEVVIMKLLNHILQPTIYEDIREVARDYRIEDNVSNYQNVDVVRNFLATFKLGMLPRNEVFVHTVPRHLEEAVKVFRVLYFAKDFDIMIRTACWLRERINSGMFVYALTAVVFHRVDCRGIVLPAPYEIYPYYFVDSKVINRAFIMKMTKGALNEKELDNCDIKKIHDKNTVVFDMRKGLRHVLTVDDRLAYFTEDIDLNTYMYYLHMNYPYWMTDEVYGLNKERHGEVVMYATQQLLARLRLERLTRNMCDIKPFMWEEPVKTGYWPKIRLPNGEEMPVRVNDVKVVNENNIREKLLLDEIETIIRQGILTGKIERRDGTVIELKKPEDIEKLSRIILGGINISHDDAKVFHLTVLFKRVLGYSYYNNHKFTYLPTALDMYKTCLRDPLFWKVMKRIMEHVVLFKKLLPSYTREEIDFPGVKVEKLVTEELVTFIDEYDMDITNAMWLDENEMRQKRPDTMMVVRQRRLNNHPFRVSIDVLSEKAVDAVVRVFIGPKYDCMGRLVGVNEMRHDMVEIDSFVHKLETGKNTIVRNSVEMHGIIEDRPWTRFLWDRTMQSAFPRSVKAIPDNWWYMSRVGFPKRLLLPLGTVGGVPMQMFVIVSPVRAGLLMNGVDVTVMKERHNCRFTTCVDTMPLGYPFDRHIDHTHFFTENMKFVDVKIFRKDMSNVNVSKRVDTSNMVMKHDDLTYLDNDMLVPRTYRDTMLMGVENITRI